MAIEIASVGTKGSNTSTSWTYSVTIPDGKGPACVVVHLFDKYGAVYNATGAIGGITATRINRRNYTNTVTCDLAVKGLQPGTYTISIGGLTGGTHAALMYSVYKTVGWFDDSAVSAAESTDGTKTYTPPVLRSGQMFVENVAYIGQVDSAYSAAMASGQTSLSGYQIGSDTTGGIRYLANFPTSQTFKTTLTNVYFNYYGIEFLPIGSIFSVPPMMIG